MTASYIGRWSNGESKAAGLSFCLFLTRSGILRSGGAVYEDMVHHLFAAIRDYPGEVPCLITYHVGANNMGNDSAKGFKNTMAETMSQVTDVIFQHGIGGAQGYMGYLWSDILPQLYYKFNRDPVSADKVRKSFNRKAHALIGPSGNRFVTHPSINYQVVSDFRNNGKDPIHLSETGINKFLLDIAAFSMTWAQTLFEG